MNEAIVVAGAGGHAKVCIELLRASGHAVSLCIGAEIGPTHCMGVPVLVGDHHWSRLWEQGYRRAFVALGGNRIRERVAKELCDVGYELVNAISPNACISPTATIGAGVAVMAGAVINADTHLSDLCIINTLASVDHDGYIGEAVHLAPHCGLAGNVTVGARAFLGVGCKVIDGVTVGDDVQAGAGTVIVSDVAPALRIKGVPARTY